ncbi:MAG: DUF167 domain-containing protein [Planctomycetes bacterium]|nr:DUF167 domain-containing protein [Planctomycetota bacterium]
MLDLRADDGGVIIAVKVVPGASATRLAGRWENRAKITVAAPAEKGKANEALAAFLAKLLGVRKRDVEVIAGHTTPLKSVRVTGISVEAARQTLEPG